MTTNATTHNTPKSKEANVTESKILSEQMPAYRMGLSQNAELVLKSKTIKTEDNCFCCFSIDFSLCLYHEVSANMQITLEDSFKFLCF